MNVDDQISNFLSSKVYAVAGASKSRYKYGNKVLRCYKQHSKEVYAINPNEIEIESVQCFKTILECPDSVDAVSIITPPEISYQIVIDCIEKGVKNIWFQPGAENWDAIEIANKNGLNVIAGGSCLLVILGYKENL